MENPVVVFVLKHKCGDKTLEFPTGWTAEGKRLNGAEEISGQNCCVILLEDDKQLPQCNHANKDTEQLLPVITHVNSNKYTEDTVANTGLASWGRPVCRDGDCFSHVKGNGIFEEILELLRSPSCAISFAQKRQLANDLDVLDQLAAVCQICMIDPNTTANVDSWSELFSTLPESGFKDKLSEAKVNSWPAALKIIATRANELSSPSPA